MLRMKMMSKITVLADDNRQELFCHRPLTGDIRRSDVDSDGQFQTPVVLMQKFCEVK